MVNTKLKETADVAIAAGKAKSHFLAQMSHEIRTPINAILGLDTMILRKSTEDAVLTFAKDIQSAGRSLLSLINEPGLDTVMYLHEDTIPVIKHLGVDGILKELQ